MVKIPKKTTQLDIEILARTLYGECRKENRHGKVAVACVILNRAANVRRWPHDIMGVCLEKLQFSCWNKNDANRDKVKAVDWSDVHFRECFSVALSTCLGNEPDPTDGCDHYCTNAVVETTSWAKNEQPYCRIGNHAFFKLA